MSKLSPERRKFYRLRAVACGIGGVIMLLWLASVWVPHYSHNMADTGALLMFPLAGMVWWAASAFFVMEKAEKDPEKKRPLTKNYYW